MPAHRQTIIGHHLIWTLYGHWLPNDLRGSGSDELRETKFAELGEIYRGRKPAEMQPSRRELREFHRKANSLLKYSRFWLNDAKRQAVGDAFGTIVTQKGYTVWACAILSNHAHMVIRIHRDDALAMWRVFAEAARISLIQFEDVAGDHPVWSTRPYKVFLRTPEEVWSRVKYVERNPAKEDLPQQRFAFVQAYDNWPFQKQVVHHAASAKRSNRA